MDLIPLMLFNERADRLRESSFLKWLNKSQKKPRKQDIDVGRWLSYEGLRPDDLDAFCLNLRLLIQDRDGYSINCLSNLYEILPETVEEARTLFKQERKKLNDYLEERSFIQIEVRNLSNRDVFNILFYGGLVHNNVKYYEDYIRLTKSGLFSIFTFVELWNILLQFNTYIQNIAMINKAVIKHLEEFNQTNSEKTYTSRA